MDDPATERVAALLAPLTNYERTRPDAVRWSLDTMHALLDRPGSKPLPGCAVQIGGSKGKGTTALYLERLARAAGLRVGCFLSPHVETVLERIRIDGRNIEEEPLLAILEEILGFLGARDCTASFFEVMAAAAHQHFAAEAVDLAIFEVGLGGRLDATTAIPVAASIVTTIELEHTELLGDTAAAIAAEKAPVLRANRPGFTAVPDSDDGALAELRHHARAVGCDLEVMGDRFGVRNPVTAPDGSRTGALFCADRPAAPFRLSAAAADVELPALALAHATLARLFPAAGWPLDPVPRPDLRGRLERFVSPENEVLLDGAHTERSLEALAGEIGRRALGRPVLVWFGAAAGKRWREGLKSVVPVADRFVVTGITGTRSESADDIAAWLSAAGSPALTTTEDDAWRLLRAHRGLVVVTGSFYLVGSVRRRLQRLGMRPG